MKFPACTSPTVPSKRVMPVGSTALAAPLSIVWRAVLCGVSGGAQHAENAHTGEILGTKDLRSPVKPLRPLRYIGKAITLFNHRLNEEKCFFRTTSYDSRYRGVHRGRQRIGAMSGPYPAMRMK